ncbi:Gluconate 5-dehydrogenase [Nymphon striatum]|nr:Gluconate 5-dehydrogenase [Nymphon striatum]
MTQDRINPDEGVAVVTGAGSGLGRALTIELSARGFSVVAIGRRRAALEETQVMATGAPVHVMALDVGKVDQVADAFAKMRDKHGPVAVLINNAAVYPRRDILEETPSSFMDVVNINLGGLFACSHAVLPDMVDRGRGRILNVSTFADIAPLPASAAYSVSKGAARNFDAGLGCGFGRPVSGDCDW